MVIKFIKSIWNALTGVKEDPVQPHPLDGATKVPPTLDPQPKVDNPPPQTGWPFPRAEEKPVETPTEEPKKKTPKQIAAERRKADSGGKRKKKST